MRIVYILLSPTFGMHQYTADLANRMATAHESYNGKGNGAGWDVHLVTTSHYPDDRYAPQVCVHTPVTTSDTGLSRELLDGAALRRGLERVLALAPDVVHVTGPHLWNVPLLQELRRHNVPVIHTLHDLDPHRGSRFGPMLHLWNGFIIRLAELILVHGQCYQHRLLSGGLPAARVAYAPLLHLFVSHERQQHLRLYQKQTNNHLKMPVTMSPRSLSHTTAPEQRKIRLLFFGRLEQYKGIDVLLKAYRQLQNKSHNDVQLVLAGPGRLADVWQEDLPLGVELHNRLIDDMDAVALFRNCDLLLLPYSDATQSALVAAAYYFQKPVLVSRSGALPEYVHDGQTGFVVDPDDPAALAQVLARIVDQPQQLRQMGKNGRLWYKQQREQEWNTLQSLYISMTI